MKKNISLSFVLFFLVVGANATLLSLPAIKSQNSIDALRVVLNKNPEYKLETISLKNAQQLLNKKLSFKEKISLKFYQAKHRIKSMEADDNSKTSIVLSILSLATVYFPIASIPFAIGGIVFASKALKVNSEDKKAKTAMALSLLSLGITIVGGLIYAIFISDSPFSIFIFK